MKVLNDHLKNLIAEQKPLGVARWRREPNGSYIIFSNHHYKYFNETAGFIYSQLNGKNSIADILEKLQATYPEVDEFELLEDIILQIRAMQKMGLVTRLATFKNISN